ncbi:hypothetical protein ILUMI_26425 [Ignelater luminosus]|uniref:Uncharacterized protein n=1 Tax=Ignelater luminosus TaxID=2038154 RepID=A0A8K0C4D3_IGNLU|nr:hypothetical protein ILUMI_26425 [Ignelater luminosus]
MRILLTILVLYSILWTCTSLQETGSFLHITDVFWIKQNDSCTKNVDEFVKHYLNRLLQKSKEYHPSFVMWSCAGGRRSPMVIKLMKEVFKDMMILPALPPVKLPASKKNSAYYRNISNYFGNWLDNEARKTFWKTGYYTRFLKTPRDLQVIVLNTAFFAAFMYLANWMIQLVNGHGLFWN